MLTDEVRSEVEHAPPAKKLSFVAFVRADEILAAVKALRNVSERSQALKDMYRAAKAPLLDTVMKQDSLSVVDALEGTPNVLLAGPARAWRRLIEDNEDVSTDTSFEIVPNTEGWATTS